ncbi:MAG: hypothetical protein P4M11_03915, partial [Candidatus Pacebacteria bacterium]|nr:hypothetical protein [Candidatus Paceibacterota bacterium]
EPEMLSPAASVVQSEDTEKFEERHRRMELISSELRLENPIQDQPVEEEKEEEEGDSEEEKKEEASEAATSDFEVASSAPLKTYASEYHEKRDEKRDCNWIRYIKLHPQERLAAPVPFSPPIAAASQQYPVVIVTPSIAERLDFAQDVCREIHDPENFRTHNLTSLRPIAIHQSMSTSCGYLMQKTIRNFELLRPDVTLHPPLQFVELKYQQACGLLADPEELELSEGMYLTRPYANNMEFKDLTAKAKKAAEKEGFKDSFIHPDSESHLNLTKFSAHPKSLSTLAQDIGWSGGDTPYAYVKWDFACFALHHEQEFHTFYHHQLHGQSRWIVFHPEDADRILPEIVEPMVRAIYFSQPDAATQTEEERNRRIKNLATILFRAKTIFPPLSVLKAAKIRYEMIDLMEGEILIGWGSLAHCGYGTRGSTVALASNLITTDWLIEGRKNLDHLLAHFQWIQEMAKMPSSRKWVEEMTQVRKIKNKKEREEKVLEKKCTVPKELTAPHQAGKDSTLQYEDQPHESESAAYLLQQALNHCPPNHVCALLKGIREAARKNEKEVKLTDAQSKLIEEIEAILHDPTVREFLQLAYVSEELFFQLCWCT